MREKFKIRMNGHKVELLEDELDPLVTAANNGETIGASDTSFVVADASVFQDGHVILIGLEYMVVKSVDLGTNTVTVYSAYGGTNATHAATAPIRSLPWRKWHGWRATTPTTAR